MNGYGAKIRELRMAKGLTMVDIRNHLGIGQAEQSRIENGITSISLEKAQAIANFLGCTVDDFL